MNRRISTPSRPRRHQQPYPHRLHKLAIVANEGLPVSASALENSSTWPETKISPNLTFKWSKSDIWYPRTRRVVVGSSR